MFGIKTSFVSALGADYCKGASEVALAIIEIVKYQDFALASFASAGQIPLAHNRFGNHSTTSRHLKDHLEAKSENSGAARMYEGNFVVRLYSQAAHFTKDRYPLTCFFPQVLQALKYWRLIWGAA